MTRGTQSRRLPIFWFPLLIKELTEKANRLRTYWIRAIYACVFFVYFGFEGYSLLQGAATGLAGLGTGRGFFQKIYSFQLVGTFLFLPSLMSGLISYEKERSALHLLLATDLAPWRIVIQNYLGGLAPMLALQMTALPMTAVAYGLGGASSGDILLAALLITCHTLHVGAFSLACWSYCRSSVSAFLMAYLLGAAWFSILAVNFSTDVTVGFPIPATADQRAAQHELWFAYLIFAILFLVVATAWLRSRADVSRRNRLRNWFQDLDQFFQRINARFGGINFSRSGTELPDDQPVRWRELHRRALASPHHRIRISLVLVSVVVVVVVSVLQSVVDARPGLEVGEISALVYSLWVLLALVIVVQGTSIISSERIGQTLEVLLTSPVSGRDIVDQKSVVYRRVASIAVAPLAVVHVTETYMESMNGIYLFVYLGFAALTLCVLVPFVYWLSVAIGLRVRSRVKATLLSLLLLFGMVAAPYVDGVNELGNALSPAGSILLNEGSVWSDSSWNSHSGWYTPSGPPDVVGGIVVNLVFYVGLGFALRQWCRGRADALLGRQSKTS